MLDDREIAAAAFMTGAFSGVLGAAATVTTDGLDVHGRDAGALFLAGLFGELEPDSIDLESVNGEPGLALRRDGRVVGVAILRMRDAKVQHVWIVTAPDKLRSWN